MELLPPINFATLPAVFAWRPACWLRVAGPDAASFLQGQFTNDLSALSPGEARYGLWLSVKGKVVADSFVARTGAEEFWIGSYHSTAATVRERLEAFIIADDVTVEDRTADWRALSVWGADALARLASLPRQAVVFAGKRGVAPNREIVFPAAVENEIQAAFSGVPTRTEAEMERERIDAAIPAVPRDVGPADLPNEAGLEVSAISYTKGCYLGQEVMARLKSMGQVRRRLLRVRGVGAPPATPAALFAGARQVGELRSAIGDGADGFIGLAMISLLPLGAERELALAAGAAPAIALRDTP